MPDDLYQIVLLIIVCAIWFKAGQASEKMKSWPARPTLEEGVG